jgi:hypothetical protein
VGCSGEERGEELQLIIDRGVTDGRRARRSRSTTRAPLNLKKRIHIPYRISVVK